MDFMCRAHVGDDVFDEDPTVVELQNLSASMFGMEAGLFCPSGTMTNQIAIKSQTQPGDEVICEAGAHIHYYEGGGIAANSGASTHAITGNRGVISAAQIEAALRPENVHFPCTKLVCLENTCNRGGGKIFPFEEIKSIKDLCSNHGLNLHLDGARLFNAIVATGASPTMFGELFDTISICLSKGLGAPVGSVLLGSAETIHKAKRIRKVLGGGMRQAGFLAAGGIFALKNNINRLAEDHNLAKSIEQALQKQPYVEQVFEVETNIVVFQVKPEVSTSEFLKHLSNQGIGAFEVGKQRIRFVTHLDLPENAVIQISDSLTSFNPAASSLD